MAVVAFVAGMTVGASVIDDQPRSTDTVPGTPTPSANASRQAPTIAPGVYRLQPGEVEDVARVADFFTAYNTGDLKAVMMLLSLAPQLTDCDYRTSEVVFIDGRAAVEAYLRDRFAEHDSWAVELFNWGPQDTDVVGVEPLQRENDTLLSLGVAGGVKRDFGVSLTIRLTSDDRRISIIGFATVGASPGVVERLCQP